MPHVVVKVAPGSSEEQKRRLAEEIVQDVMSILNRREEVISVGIEEVDPKDWTETVYKPEIQGKWETLYKKPGYNPLKK
jgi:4-oxalocrotonate tautomerase